MSKWRRFGDILKAVGPMILVMAGVPPPLVGTIVNGIDAAEKIPGATGAEKKDHVLDIAKEAMRASDIVTSTDFDEDAIAANVSAGIDAVVGATNGVKDGLKGQPDPEQPD